MSAVGAHLFAGFEEILMTYGAEFFFFVFEQAGASYLEFRFADVAEVLFFGDPVQFAAGASLILRHSHTSFIYIETLQSLRVVLYAFVRNL